MKKNTYDMIYSLGINCGCAEYLRKHYLRKKSGPFDWIVSEDTEAPFKTLLDGFHTFLDFSFLQQQAMTKTVNTTVLHTQNGYVFLHDFFKIESVEKQQPFVLEKYKRRIERLLADLNSHKHILLCWYGENTTQLRPETVLFYIQQIREKYAAQIDFLFIAYTKGQKNLAVQTLAPGVTWYALPEDVINQRQEGNLLWDCQHVDPIFDTLSVTNYKKTPFLILRAVFYRLLSNLIWNRAKRHRFLEEKLKS